jgi:hypothetical protein
MTKDNLSAAPKEWDAVAYWKSVHDNIVIRFAKKRFKHAVHEAERRGLVVSEESN